MIRNLPTQKTKKSLHPTRIVQPEQHKFALDERIEKQIDTGAEGPKCTGAFYAVICRSGGADIHQKAAQGT